MSPIVHTREILCDSNRAAVWKLITDTNRVNKLAGLPAVEVRTEAAEFGPRFLVKTGLFGVDVVEYEERPFEWVEGERFSILRKMRSGPLKSLEMIFSLEDRSDGKAGTLIRLRLTLQPASLLFVPVAKVVGKQALSKLVKALTKIDRSISTGRMPALKMGKVNETLLQRADAALAQLAPTEDLRKDLVDLVRIGTDDRLDRIRPFELAARWSADRRRVLTLCLNAVLAGLLELRWDLVCPSCRTSADQLGSLNDVTDSGHCDLCDIRFELDLDRSVEATFRPAPAVRKLDPQTYCIGGPARTPHVVSQSVLRDGAAQLPAPPDTGRYRLFLRGGATATVQVALGGAAEASFVMDGDALSPAQVTLAPRARINLQCARPEAHVKLERLGWASQAATAHVVSTLPTFRRQFSQEILRPGLSLKVGRVAILFSDLTGSTELYSRVGDAKAFHLVQDHFDLLTHIIDEHGGTIVKTIGDAVMACFIDEAEAVRAAAAMLGAFPDFAREHEHGEGLTLKLGIYAGACYAVTANDLLDYFGQTVNIAARLQGQAGAGELILTEQLADQAVAEGWLPGATVTEPYAAELKGLDAPLDVVRVTL